MKLLSEYFNEDEDRFSMIFDDNGTYVVRFLRNGNTVKETRFPDKHLCYVEDAADNWVRGVMKA